MSTGEGKDGGKEERGRKARERRREHGNGEEEECIVGGEE